MSKKPHTSSAAGGTAERLRLRRTTAYAAGRMAVGVWAGLSVVGGLALLAVAVVGRDPLSASIGIGVALVAGILAAAAGAVFDLADAALESRQVDRWRQGRESLADQSEARRRGGV